MHHTRATLNKLRLLLCTPKNERSVANYLLDIKKTVDSLSAIGTSISTAEHIDAILDDLSKDYDGFITSILSHSDPYNVDELESLLLAQEERFEKNKVLQSSIIQENNVTTPWFSTCPNKNKLNFHNKGFRNRLPPHPNTANSFSGPRHTTCPFYRSPAPWNPIKQFCQICHKPGDTADTCWHRYDSPNNHSFMVNVSQYSFSVDEDSTPSILGAPLTIEDSLWYPDSGSTHHVTKDSSIFNTKHLYHESESLKLKMVKV